MKNKNFRTYFVFTCMLIFITISLSSCNKIDDQNPKNGTQDQLSTSEIQSNEDTNMFKNVAYHSVDSVKNRGVLKIGMRAFRWSWFKMPEDKKSKTVDKLNTDEWFGWEKQLCEKIAEDMSVKCDFVEFNKLSSMMEALKSGEIDMVVSGLLIDAYSLGEEYAISVGYDSWVKNNFIIFTRKGEALSSNPIFGTRDQKPYIDSIKAVYKNSEIKKYTSEENYFKALKNKEIDAVVESPAKKDVYLKNNNDIALSRKQIKDVSPGKGIFFMKGNENLKNFIDSEIEKYALNPGCEASKWYSKNYSIAKKWNVL